MSRPSKWPLPPESSRFLLPRRIVDELNNHPLSKDLYPTGFGYYKEAHNHKMTRLKHDDHLMIYCLDGRGELTVNNKVYDVYAGDIVLLPKGLSHIYKAANSQPWTIYWVHFSGLQSEAFIDYIAIKNNINIIPLGIHSRLVNNFEYLLESRQTGYKLVAFINVANILRQILSHIALLKPLVRQKQAAHQLDLEHIHSLMEAHIHEQLDLNTLAKAVNLSKFHFVKKYKELTGSTPIDHFIHLKIKRACDLLDITNKSINQIGFSIGYDDAYYFSRIFKKVMGFSPSQYRNMRLESYSFNRNL
jgi:AraC-like DNA-binding protein|tara:strand:- start:10662 stop:11570 length:909 start_codon:yes stop_codon:yes gene_type:complete